MSQTTGAIVGRIHANVTTYVTTSEHKKNKVTKIIKTVSFFAMTILGGVIFAMFLVGTMPKQITSTPSVIHGQVV